MANVYMLEILSVPYYHHAYCFDAHQIKNPGNLTSKEQQIVRDSFSCISDKNASEDATCSSINCWTKIHEKPKFIQNWTFEELQEICKMKDCTIEIVRNGVLIYIRGEEGEISQYYMNDESGIVKACNDLLTDFEYTKPLEE